MHITSILITCRIVTVSTMQHFIAAFCALQICKDCRCNVMRAYKDLKPCARDQKAGEQSLALEICAGHKLTVHDGLVCVDGKATTEFFEQAEEVEDCNVSNAHVYWQPC